MQFIELKGALKDFTVFSLKDIRRIDSHFYRSIKPELFFGFDIVENNGVNYKIAGIEKTLLDYFYFNPHINDKSGFEGLRFNTESFLNQIQEEKLNTYLYRFGNKALTKRINSFMRFCKNV